jgi:hypothetical protein
LALCGNQLLEKPLDFGVVHGACASRIIRARSAKARAG